MSQQSGWFIWLGVHIFAASAVHFSNAACTLRWAAIFSLAAFSLASAAWRLAWLSLLMTSTIGGALPPRVCLPLSALLLKNAKNS